MKVYYYLHKINVLTPFSQCLPLGNTMEVRWKNFLCKWPEPAKNFHFLILYMGKVVAVLPSQKQRQNL